MANSQVGGDTHNKDSIYVQSGTSGGGSAGGQYVFADLTELDAIIATLQTEIDDITGDDWYFLKAIREANAPADDLMSNGQVNAYRAALEKGRQHNKAVLAYAENQLTKLQAARQSYTESETNSAETYDGIGEGIP